MEQKMKPVRRKDIYDRAMIPVLKCPRCGKKHGMMEFSRLRRPAKDYSWWASCPKTGEPLLSIEKGHL
jgi:hypothetical protein